MKKHLIGLLLVSFIFTTVNCNRSTAKSKVEDNPFEKYEHLNEMDEELIREGEQFDDSIESFDEEGEGEEFYENYQSPE